MRIRVISLILCISFLAACSSSSDVVSAKRKYRKGWFFHRAGDADNNIATTGKDSGLTHNYTATNNPKEQAGNPDATTKEDQKLDNKIAKQERRDSLKAFTKAEKADKKQKQKEDRAKAKAGKTPDPPDDIYMRLLILIVVLASLATLTTGLITPIVVWGITQNFLITIGVIASFISFFVSVNTKLGINPPKDGAIQRQYNLGKPSFVLALWAVAPITFLCVVVSTNLLFHLWVIEVATLFSFVGAACILISFLLAVKAFFVTDRHPGKAWLGLLLDASLVTSLILVL